MNVLLISAEVAPFAKVGGLADVAGALPKALRDLGHDVRVVMPCYKMIENDSRCVVEEVLRPFPVPIRQGLTEQAFVKSTTIHTTEGDIPVFLIGGIGDEGRPGHFSEATDSTKVYTYAPEPYVFFCRAVLEMVCLLDDGWIPDVLHCNDWHTGLIPVFAHANYRDVPRIAQAATVFTIHNLAYQGNFERGDWEATGLADSLYTPDGLEFYGGWSFMKGGLTFADRINTVSENYAREIQTPEYACGLEGLMQTLDRTGRLSGILNGIDYEIYNPKTDPYIPSHFEPDNLRGKAECKAELQAELSLDRDSDCPLVGLVSRLADQKGLDLIHAIIEDMLALPVQFALLGTGDKAYEAFFRCLQDRYPGKVHARIAFDVGLAQRIYASSDLFLMPSRFEPCGLGQMMALRYGTIPIVRATGGLADSIMDLGEADGAAGNGFVFQEYSPNALLQCMERAVIAFQRREKWSLVVSRALRCDFSWKRSALRYDALFRDAVAVHTSDRKPLALEPR